MFVGSVRCSAGQLRKQPDPEREEKIERTKQLRESGNAAPAGTMTKTIPFIWLRGEHCSRARIIHWEADVNGHYHKATVKMSVATSQATVDPAKIERSKEPDCRIGSFIYNQSYPFQPRLQVNMHSNRDRTDGDQRLIHILPLNGIPIICSRSDLGWSYG